MSAADSALSSAGDVMQRANELAIQAANGTLSPEQLKEIGLEVDQLRQNLVQLAGTAVGDTHVFSGFKTDTAPYASAAAAYAGDGNAIMARIAPGSQVQVNIPGDVAFGPAFDALNKLYAETSAGTQVSGATLSAVDAGQQGILDARATIGARQNRLDAASQVLDDAVLASKTLQSKLEDVDIASAISELSTRQATYQASLAVNAKILQTSLIDYLT
jgi:flagellar hook-associated protein 3 FlgL